MRIGILTFHRPINYGAFLQAFAFSERLAKEFPECTVEIVDYIAPLEKRKIPINVLWGIKHYGVVNGLRDLQKIRSFHKVYKFLPLSKKNCFLNLHELYQYIDQSFDLLVIGSDAVFNWNQNGYPTAFIPDYSFEHCKITSYAASVHGLKYASEPLDRLCKCGEAFQKMLVVGVRDNCTKDFVNRCCADAECVRSCDPTLTMDAGEIMRNAEGYEMRILQKHKCDLSQKYIVLMMPDCTFTQKVHEIYSNKYQIVALFKPSSDADIYLYDLDPFEWAAVLARASLVITSYFHGTLLSLKQNTPVVCIDFSDYNSRPYEGKLHDLMCNGLDLPECYFDSRDIENASTQKRMFEMMDAALSGAFCSRIETAVQNEAKTFDDFCKLLKKKLGDGFGEN